MPIFNNILAGAAGQSGGAAGYEIERSLRFNSPDSAYLSRNFSTGNRKTWTWSGWVKKNKPDTFETIFSAAASGTGIFLSNTPGGIIGVDGTYDGTRVLRHTTAVFRDVSAWYHIVVALDTTQSTDSDRIKLYVNGSQVDLPTATDGTWPAQNSEGSINNNINHAIGVRINTNDAYCSCGLADVHFIDGQALAPTDFGEYDANGVWQPKEVSVSSINDGTNWASSSYNAVTGTTGSTDMTNAFDGSLSTYTSLGSGDGSATSTVTFTPPSSITVTKSVRVYIGVDRGQSISVNGSQTNASVSAGWNDTGFTGTLSSLAIGPTIAGSSSNIAAIEINGEILISSYNNSSGYGTNGFHLDFSDNSSASALGTDSSGNSNDWTVNNLVADGLFSSTLFSNPGNAFDGSSSTYAEVNTSSGLGELIFPNGIQVSSSVKIKYSSSTAGNVYLNGSATALAGTGVQEHNISFSGTLNKIGIQSSSQPVIYYVDIDNNGTYLTGVAAENQDSLIDTPTNYTAGSGNNGGNYCTWNPLAKDGDTTLSNGNLDLSSTNYGNNTATFFLTSGKWYWEGQGTGYVAAICGKSGINWNDSISSTGSNSIGWWTDGPVYWDGGNNSGSTSYASTDIVGTAVDMDAGVVYFYKNGSLVYTITFGSGTVPDLSDGVFPCYNNGQTTTKTVVYNFGQRPFAYAPPSGHLALCTTNLPDPDPAIADGSKAMDVVLYTGNGVDGQSITGLGFSPEFVWVKKRSAAAGHGLFDVVRGASNTLATNNTQTETVNSAYGKLQSFDSNGFTVTAGTDLNDPRDIVNVNGATYVAWAWDAGSSTVSNTDGSLTSSVRANASAGFSIVSYTGSTGTGSFGHGLNAAPEFVIIKNREESQDWTIYHKGLTLGDYLKFTPDQAIDYPMFNDAHPNSSVVYVGNDDQVSKNDIDYIAYCWAPVEGYSAFGKFDATEPFVYLGFTPRWLLLKDIDEAAKDWCLYDTAREPFNPNDTRLEPNTADSFTTNATIAIDFLSNGFKIKGSGTTINGNVIYAAFAEHPFKTARAR